MRFNVRSNVCTSRVVSRLAIQMLRYIMYINNYIVIAKYDLHQSMQPIVPHILQMNVYSKFGESHVALYHANQASYSNSQITSLMLRYIIQTIMRLTFAKHHLHYLLHTIVTIGTASNTTRYSRGPFQFQMS